MSTWKQLKDLNFLINKQYFTNPAKINQNEFIILSADKVTVIPNDDPERDNITSIIESINIHSFNVKTNKWHLMTTFNVNMMSNAPYSSIYNPSDNCVYVVQQANGSRQDDLYIVNLESFNVSQHNMEQIYIWNIEDLYMIHQHFHVIDEDVHQIFDLEIKNFDTIYGSPCLSEGSGVYLKMTDKFLHFGGYSSDTYSSTDLIHEYLIKHKKWKTLSCKLPRKTELCRCVATNDEKVVFVLGGRSYDGVHFYYEQKYDILIYDVEKEEIRKSEVKLPEETNKHLRAIVMNEDTQLLTYGYIRDSRENIPLDIIQLIDNFLSRECMYLMVIGSKITKYFWKISIDEILNH